MNFKKSLLLAGVLFTAISLSSLSCSTKSTASVESKKTEGKAYLVLTDGEKVPVKVREDGVKEVSVEQVMQLLSENRSFYLIDVRTPEEYTSKHIPNTPNIPKGIIEEKLDANELWKDLNGVPPAKDAPIILYCRSGNRSGISAGILQEKGYTNISSMAGGMIEWEQKN